MPWRLYPKRSDYHVGFVGLCSQNKRVHHARTALAGSDSETDFRLACFDILILCTKRGARKSKCIICTLGKCIICTPRVQIVHLLFRAPHSVQRMRSLRCASTSAAWSPKDMHVGTPRVQIMHYSFVLPFLCIGSACILTLCTGRGARKSKCMICILGMRLYMWNQFVQRRTASVSRVYCQCEINWFSVSRGTA